MKSLRWYHCAVTLILRTRWASDWLLPDTSSVPAEFVSSFCDWMPPSTRTLLSLRRCFQTPFTVFRLLNKKEVLRLVAFLSHAALSYKLAQQPSKWKMKKDMYFCYYTWVKKVQYLNTNKTISTLLERPWSQFIQDYWLHKKLYRIGQKEANLIVLKCSITNTMIEREGAKEAWLTTDSVFWWKYEKLIDIEDWDKFLPVWLLMENTR